MSDVPDTAKLEVTRYENIWVTYSVDRGEWATKIINKYKRRGFKIECSEFDEKEKVYEVMLTKVRALKR